MAENTDNSGSVEEYSGKWWSNELQAVEKELDTKWRAAADKVVNRYLDVRSDGRDDSVDRRYNVFWSNTEILKAALYATPPKPMVTRQYGDAKDDVARTAALILQRMLTFDVAAEGSKTHRALKLGVEDFLIPGAGQAWVRYDAETEKVEIPAVTDPYTGQEISPATTGERITYECAPVEFVQWRDFMWSPARTWAEVWWVARRVWMKKKAFIKTFSKGKYDELKEKTANLPKHDILPKGFEKGRVEVFEVWCEDTNKVYWIHRNLDDVLKSQDDPLQLDNFFPCPEPLLATHTSNSLIPRSDFTMVQDQYDELDTLNDRISTLTKAVRVVGVYDKTQSELKQMITGGEFNMIAVDNWAMLAEKGGIKGVVDWFPVEEIANVLKTLNEQRMLVIEQIYELTSISDIMRGASNPRETLGAQKLKAQYSSVRLQLKQQAVGEWVQAVMRIRAEVICRHFQPETIAQQSQIQQTESVGYAQAAIELLKNYQQAEYRISVSEQTLSMADYNAEREMRVEYITAFGQFLSQAAQVVQAMPGALPFMLRILQWVTAAFRGSQDVESVLDEAIQSAKQNPPQGQQQAQDNPAGDIAKAQAQAHAAQITAQVTVQKAQMDNQSKERIAHAANQTQVLIEEMKEGQAQQELAVEVTGIKADLAQSSAELQHQAAQAEQQRVHDASQQAESRDAAQHLQDTKPVPKPTSK